MSRMLLAAVLLALAGCTAPRKTFVRAELALPVPGWRACLSVSIEK